MADPNPISIGRPRPAVGGNGSDGDDGDVRERLARLEVIVNGIKDDIDRDIARKTDVLNLKVWIVVGALGAVVTLVVGLLTAANIVVNALRVAGGS